MTKEKTGYFTPERNYIKCFSGSLIALLVALIFFYFDYTSPTNQNFNVLIITSGILKAPAVAGGYVQIKPSDKKTLYFPQYSGKSRHNYMVDLKKYHNQNVKIWWYSNKPFKAFNHANYIYQMEVDGKLVITYEDQKYWYSINRYTVAIISATISFFLIVIGAIGYSSNKDNLIPQNT